MKNRWGSCNAKDSIILNPEIIKAPSKCIEYVIIHEICHLIEKSHSHKFYKILSEKMSNWEKWKRRLEDVMA
jgi:predicted metal-dependent hydrolase